ncbi:MAG: multifunctional oxoglutarate decarboxylase/oxoglutarate dehydrogenase thiamine pyrophosphate-binding subunit/dihydrolipoyllysine-residue succinyltransferase subunit [Gemmatimonadota bacterium]|nr:MAG: multifunctional oxoglutarate decarboxylase/oxoglutarate dehydrogenase thiamine pyrophosphate-binding subunit/dihydrolipoyllysine-residue succinyltransferase subunit [Gemmatimonadota bacterium]
MFENVFETVNSGFAQALYEDYLRDPSSVPDEWRELFDNGLTGEQPVVETVVEGAAAEQGKPEEPEPGVESISHPAASARPPSDMTGPIDGPALRLLQNMEASLTIPTATSFRDLEVSRLWDVRRALNESLQSQGIKLSFTHIIGWAIVRAMRQYPVMGFAVLDRDGSPHRVERYSVDLGLAVDTEGKDGRRKLLVPVVKHADQMTFRQFYDEYERLVVGARDGRLMPDAYMGASVTLTNPGTIGTVASVPRLMTGQGSIIATGAIQTVSGTRRMTVTSTYDHRIIQGAESGLFLRQIDLLLQGEEGFYDDIAREMGVRVEGAPRAAEPTPPAPARDIATVSSTAGGLLTHVASAMSLVSAYRTHGYLDARLDPLGTEPIGDPALHPKSVGLTPQIMRQIPAAVLGVYVEGETMADVLPQLQEMYCGTIAYEIEHIADHKERVWLRQLIESGVHRRLLTSDRKLRTLTTLTKVTALEEFLHRTYLGQKRFGIEGLEMLVPVLETAIDLAAEQGVREVVMGMAHRGRLNVLTHILGVPYESLLAEFEGGHETHDTLAAGRSTGDVKYHYGANGVFECLYGQTVDVILMPNPSHLEAVNPVVEGHVRASQTDRSGERIRHDPRRVLPILMHGDAAFAAQGVVAETFNLACLEGYNTGGTLHVITNNQIGFTTDPCEARSTDFASDLAKGFDVPIVHVNADDPDACLAAARLAMMYRDRFAKDSLIHLVGYRRYGHNEGDEPRYTQPMMYARIDVHPPVKDVYARVLIAEGVVSAEEVERDTEQAFRELSDAHSRVKTRTDADSGVNSLRPSAEWTAVAEPDTRVSLETLHDVNTRLIETPDGFTVNRKLQRFLDRRRKVFEDGGPIDWAHAEALALGTLLVDGIPLRMVGQDTERGTFSQRHLVLHDAKTGSKYTPLKSLAKATAPIELHNTPLSEYGALGFEYGYSVAAPETLVMWEAQFGDFANSAEVIIDQFVIGGLAKWGETSRLVLLLPHGYEGQGPEHSSARLERYLALGAEGNIRVANCSTPAQYFHLLRRQAKHMQLRPLFLMAPKSLLRHPHTVSQVADLTQGQFRYVMDDISLPGPRETVLRIVFCSGKIYYDAITASDRPSANHVAIARIELLYPFPEDAVIRLIGLYPNVREIVWLQEEPVNMGARKWVVPQLAELIPEWVSLRYVARPERSAPAEGYLNKHLARQARLVADVLSPMQKIKSRA